MTLCLVQTQGRAGHRQRGASLIVGMIFMVLITFVVINAFNLSSTNLRSVRNEQSRTEAIAAANRYLEQLIAAPNVFSSTGNFNTTITLVDDPDRPVSYTVLVPQPVCMRAVRATISGPSEIELGSAVSGSNTWDVDFEFVATVNDASTGTLAEIRQGVRARLTDLERTNRCGAATP